MAYKYTGGHGQITKQAAEWQAAKGVLVKAYNFTESVPGESAYQSYSGGSAYIENGYIRMVYPEDTIGGGLYNFLSVQVPPDTSEIYAQFKARFPSTIFGLKFFKIFGVKDGETNVANTTFLLDYTGVSNGDLTIIGFGDGTVTANDTDNTISLDGSNPSFIGRSYGSATVETPQNAFFDFNDSDWHEFKIYAKFNSGDSAETETNDGAYYVEVDGDVYVNATGLYNRHYSNGPIDSIHFGDWSQGATSEFTIDYTDIRVTTGGF